MTKAEKLSLDQLQKCKIPDFKDIQQMNQSGSNRAFGRKWTLIKNYLIFFKAQTLALIYRLFQLLNTGEYLINKKIEALILLKTPKVENNSNTSVSTPSLSLTQSQEIEPIIKPPPSSATKSISVKSPLDFLDPLDALNCPSRNVTMETHNKLTSNLNNTRLNDLNVYSPELNTEQIKEIDARNHKRQTLMLKIAKDLPVKQGVLRSIKKTARQLFASPIKFFSPDKKPKLSETVNHSLISMLLRPPAYKPNHSILLSWVNDMSLPPKEKESRIKACKQIEKVIFDKLTTLDLSSMQLTALPNIFNNLLFLETIDLRGNSLTELPISFSRLEQLTLIRSDKSLITALPGPLCMRIAEQKLVNQVGPDLLVEQSALLPFSTPNLNNSPQETIDRRLLKLLKDWAIDKTITETELLNRTCAKERLIACIRSKTTVLDLSNLGLTCLPNVFDYLVHITILVIKGNSLLTLPPSVDNLTNLTSITLESNYRPILSNRIQTLVNSSKLSVVSISPLETPKKFRSPESYISEDEAASDSEASPEFRLNPTIQASLAAWMDQPTLSDEEFENQEFENQEFENQRKAKSRLIHCIKTNDQVLDFSGLELSSLPDVFETITHIKKLYIESNHQPLLPAVLRQRIKDKQLECVIQPSNVHPLTPKREIDFDAE